MKIKIGADELILWLRKNEYAKGTTNEVIGRNIRRIIESCNGNLIAEDVETFWDNNNNARNIGENLLPQTAAQYEIDTNHLQDLYETLIETYSSN